jgi:hypothetical protein
LGLGVIPFGYRGDWTSGLLWLGTARIARISPHWKAGYIPLSSQIADASLIAVSRQRNTKAANNPLEEG